MERRPGTPEGSQGEEHPGRRAALARLRRLQSLSNRGLWALVLFTALSLWAGTGFRGVPAMPEEWRAVMGRPPPPTWIGAAFLLYVFSALVLSLTRMAGSEARFGGFQHVAYLAAFYGFYEVSGALEENYWAVLVGGFAVLTLEGYRNWLRYRLQIREEMERVGRG